MNTSLTLTAPQEFLTSRGLRFFSKLLVVATFLLIFKGALVTSNSAGLTVPDWPTTYGENMFLFPPSKWVGGIFYEHVHRLLASGIGFLTLTLSIWMAFAEPRKWVRVLGYVALGTVICQGVLGGLTVLYLLPTAVSSAHGVLGQTFFILTILIAYSHSVEFQSRAAHKEDARSMDRGTTEQQLLWMTGAVLCLIYVQLIVGAVMRHSGSGLAVPDFPTIGGHILPDLSDTTLATINEMRLTSGLREVGFGQVAIHLVHRSFGFIIVFAISMLLSKAWKTRTQINRITLRSICLLMGVVCVQFSLGAFTLWSVRDPIITSLHVVTGAALLGISVLTFLRIAPLAHRHTTQNEENN